MINYLKHNNKQLLFSLLLSAIVFIPLFKNGIYRGYDLQFHLNRLDGIIQSIKDGQFPLAIYPYKNYGFGYPSSLFYCDIFLIIPSIIRYVFNINIVTMYKIIIFVCIFLTSYTTLHYSYKLTNNIYSSFLGTIIFTLSNYYLTDIYDRMALGEIMAMVFIPSLIYAIYEFIYLKKNNWIKLGLLFDCVLFSHNISFFLCVILFGILLIININTILNKESIIILIKATTLAGLLSLFYLLPMFEQVYLQDLAMNHTIYNTMKDDALSIKDLFSDICMQFDFTYGNIDGLTNMDVKTIGLPIIILPLFGLTNYKRQDKFTKQGLIVGYILILCMTEIVPLFKIPHSSIIQYPSRLCVIVLPLLAYLVADIYKDFKCDKILLIIVSILLIFNVSYLYSLLLNNEDITVISEDASIKELFTDRKYAKQANIGANTNREELANGEYLPYQSNEFDYLNACRDIIYRDKILTDYIREGTRFEFTISADKDVKVTMPITWYPGYYACELDNGKCIKDIDLTSDRLTNRVIFTSKEGSHSYLLYYRGTSIQKYSTYISLASFFLFVTYLIKRRESHK